MNRNWLRIAVFTLCCLSLTVAAAQAAFTLEEKIRLNKEREELQQFTPGGVPKATAETEPNDTCGAADPADLLVDDVDAAIDAGGDEDWFVIRATAGECLTLATASLNGSGTDTQLRIFDGCPGAEVAFNDDGGPGLFSLIEDFVVTATGNLYVQVRHFSATGTGEYTLSATLGACPVLPDNNTCDTAQRVECKTTVTGDTSTATNDLADPNGSCLPFGGFGPDVFYETLVPNGFIINVVLTPTAAWDPAVWIVTDCADESTCLTGADGGLLNDAETTTWFNQTGGDVIVYVIADSFSGVTSGPFDMEITCGQVVPTEDKNWGALKSHFTESD